MLHNIRNQFSSVPYKRITLSFRGYAVMSLITVMLISTYSVLAVPEPGLVAVGPISSATGFPTWYKDSNGTRLELCLDALSPLCAFLPGDVPDPNSPLTMPDNFPEEAFWMLGSSNMATDAADGKAILVLALEAAFSIGAPAPGDQVSFGRVRIWVDNLVPSAQYRVTHPYGVDTFTADPVFDRRMIRYTEDIGIGAPGDFSGALNSRIGPFLVWDPNVLPEAPVGYIGDPDVLHPVVGSPNNTNFFRIEGPTGSFPGSPDQCADPALGDNPLATDDCIESNLFSMVGKYATNAGVSPNRATYTQSNAVGGQIDIFAVTEPLQDIQVDGYGNPLLIGDGNGNYFARAQYSGDPPAQLQITITSDTPDESKTISVVDQVTITKAEFDVDAGILKVNAISSDTFNDPVLTASGFGALDASGKLEVAGLAIPPQHITVTSARGGSATVAVVVMKMPDVCYNLSVGHTGAGSDPSVSPSNSVGCASGTYFPGENISLSGAVPSSGSQVVGWTGTANDSSTNSDNTFTMPSTNHVIGIDYADIPPTVVTSNRLNASPSSLGTVWFSLTFSEAVTGVDVSDFTLTLSGGVSGASIVNVIGSGATRSIAVNTGTGSGAIRLDVEDNDSIIDVAGSPLGGAAGSGDFTAGQSYTIDRTAPTVVSSARLNTNPNSFATVFFSVTFSESVTGVNAADFTLTNTGTITGASIASVSGSGATRTVAVSTGTGSGTIRLDVVDDDSIMDLVGNRLGGTGADNGSFNTGTAYNVR